MVEYLTNINNIYVVLFCFFTFCVPCCDVHYDFRIITMFGSSLTAPGVCRSAHILFTLFVFACVSNTYCVVILFCLSSACVPNVASFSELSIFDCPFFVLQLLYNSYWYGGNMRIHRLPKGRGPYHDPRAVCLSWHCTPYQ